MWFSPRSKKVRYVMNKISVETRPQLVNYENDQQASLYDFVSLTPPRVSEKPKKTCKRSGKRKKKKTLTEINQQWNLVAEREDGEPASEEVKDRQVSFCDQLSIIASPQRNGGIDVTVNGSESASQYCVSPTEVSLPVIDVTESPKTEDRNEVMTPKENLCAGDPTSKKSFTTALNGKRKPHNRLPTPISKRGRRSDPGPAGEPTMPTVLSEDMPSLGSPLPPSSKPQAGALRRKSTDVLDEPSRFSPSTPPSTLNSSPYRRMMLSPSAKKLTSSSGSLVALKRNHRGETPLHIASIKVGYSNWEIRFLNEDECESNFVGVCEKCMTTKRLTYCPSGNF